MKLTEFIQDVGQPVAYYPKLRKITGGVTASILLCQFIYWRGKERDKNGWLYKTSAEIEDETGLTYNEQKTARALLKDAGLIEEHYARLDHQMKFRVNLDVVNEKWRKTESDIPESDISTFGNDTESLSLNELKTTTENTTEQKIKCPIMAAMKEYKIAGQDMTTGDLVNAWKVAHTDEWIIKAIKQAAGKHQNYVDKILLSWEDGQYPKTHAKKQTEPPARKSSFRSLD